jgi:CheY-like chemotaxis protein
MTHILVIDDDAAVRDSVEVVLTAVGYSVATATDGRRGLRACASQRPDLVITDVLMPEMEGVETIRKLRELYGAVPILAISGGWRAPQQNLLELVAQLGANETLEKPFERSDLLRAVARCLRDDLPPDTIGILRLPCV